MILVKNQVGSVKIKNQVGSVTIVHSDYNSIQAHKVVLTAKSPFDLKIVTLVYSDYNTI